MENIIYGLLIVLGVVALVVVFREYSPIISDAFRRFKHTAAPRISEKRTQVLKAAFLSSDKPGRYFVELIATGEFGSIKTVNHGSDFPDNRQIHSFKKYATKDVAAAIDKIGEGI